MVAVGINSMKEVVIGGTVKIGYLSETVQDRDIVTTDH